MEGQEFNFEKIGGKLGAFFKKKPVLIAGGVLILAGGIYYFSSQGTSETVEYAAGDTEAASGAVEESSEIDLTELEQKLMDQLEDITDRQYEDLRVSQAGELESMFSAMANELSAYTEKYETVIASPAIEEVTHSSILGPLYQSYEGETSSFSSNTQNDWVKAANKLTNYVTTEKSKSSGKDSTGSISVASKEESLSQPNFSKSSGAEKLKAYAGL